MLGNTRVELQVKDKLLSMAREACQTCLIDMHSRTQLLIVHPSVLNDFCSYMVCSLFHPPSMPCQQPCSRLAVVPAHVQAFVKRLQRVFTTNDALSQAATPC